MKTALRKKLAEYLRGRLGEFSAAQVARRFGCNASMVYQVNKDMGGGFLRVLKNNTCKTISELHATRNEDLKQINQQVRVVRADGTVEVQERARTWWGPGQ